MARRDREAGPRRARPLSRRPLAGQSPPAAERKTRRCTDAPSSPRSCGISCTCVKKEAWPHGPGAPARCLGRGGGLAPCASRVCLGCRPAASSRADDYGLTLAHRQGVRGTPSQVDCQVEARPSIPERTEPISQPSQLLRAHRRRAFRPLRVGRVRAGLLASSMRGYRVAPHTQFPSPLGRQAAGAVVGCRSREAVPPAGGEPGSDPDRFRGGRVAAAGGRPAPSDGAVVSGNSTAEGRAGLVVEAIGRNGRSTFAPRAPPLWMDPLLGFALPGRGSEPSHVPFPEIRRGRGRSGGVGSR
jgi:hypothetical protein